MRTKKQSLIISLSLLLGFCLYVFASLLAFRSDSDEIILLTSISGFFVLVLGYESAIILGGKMSLGLAEFISRITRSTHVVEVIEDEPTKTIRNMITQKLSALFVFALVFVLSVALSWNIFNLHDPQTGIFHPLLHALDVFSKSTSLNPIVYSVEVIPAMVILIAIGGVVPSIALPYLRKFKITGVNSEPFHTYLLFTVIGLVAGFGVLLTLVGFIYEELWSDKDLYYRYVLLAMLGLSLHYSIGSFLGRDKSEDIVKAMLDAESGKRVTVGTVSIQRAKEKEKDQR